MNTIAYFALLRNSHSFSTIARIRETTQLLINVYNMEGRQYIHPLKVWNRYTPTMFLPHAVERSNIIPLMSSLDISRIFTTAQGGDLIAGSRILDYWDRMFSDAAELDRESRQVERLFHFIIGKEEKILALAKKHMTVQDIIDIKSRMIGSGSIGGKAVGMLTARAILREDESVFRRLEPHDSFFIGSDVFYSFIVQNNLWQLRMLQRSPEGYFLHADELKQKLLQGEFPDLLKEQFQQMLEHFGQAPIIVRSSSLLEDSYGNAFAGKYESVFCVNQGTPESRYRQFEDAVRKVYASTMNEDALEYRRKRGLDQSDEQMAILVQRVSGNYRDMYFFPDIAGVGNSYNTYVWNREMDPGAGMLRLVYGLGTRAVDRAEEDYPRIVALDHPLMHTYGDMGDMGRYSQHYMDVLNIGENIFQTKSIRDITYPNMESIMNLVAVRDRQRMESMQRGQAAGKTYWIMTFERLLSRTDFPSLMQKMMKRLEEAYEYPVDVEFTANLGAGQQMHINLVQCRPLQVKGREKKGIPVENINIRNVFYKGMGSFMGGSASLQIDQMILIDPGGYSRLTQNEKYEIARLIGRINRSDWCAGDKVILLAGPGRWGTSTPSLGVPVSYAEISNLGILVEIEFESEGLCPELSYGTHFFQDLVENSIFYAAVFPGRADIEYQPEWIERQENLFVRYFPEYAGYENVVKMLDLSENPMFLTADVTTQQICLFFSDNMQSR
ncbi:MAG TPA: phosphoenolpyruvate synthase [Clostridiales bacterium]|nr:phosphoenolpyruvate synthase [Clostridiales bacterium]